MVTDVDRDNQQINEGSNSGIATDTVIPISTGDSAGNSESSASEPKRKRGRPKGSRNKGTIATIIGSGYRGDSEPDTGETNPTTEYHTETTIDIQEQKPKRGRPRKVSKKVIENPADTSRLILDKFEELASTLLGEQGKFEPTERFFLEIGMSDTLSKMPQETVEKVVGIISPVSLVIGVALYGVRVGSIVVEKQKNKTEANTEPQFIQENSEQSNPNGFSNFRMSESIVPPVTNLRAD